MRRKYVRKWAASSGRRWQPVDGCRQCAKQDLGLLDDAGLEAEFARWQREWRASLGANEAAGCRLTDVASEIRRRALRGMSA